MKDYRYWAEEDFRAYRDELELERDQELADLRDAHCEAGSPLDSEWSLDLSVDDIYDRYEQIWTMLLSHALHAGCSSAVLDAVEAW